MAKWEYILINSKNLPEAEKSMFKQSKVTLEEAQRYLNKLGDEGWEIIDLDFDFLIHHTGAFVGVAKRQKA